MHNITQVKEKFISMFGKPELVLSASGRANIIGEHTDYYGGFVFPFAIDKAIYFCASKSDEDAIYSLDFDEYFSPSDNYEIGSWHKYTSSVLEEIRKKYVQVSGVKIAFGGDLPIGSGISSSSALCCGMIEAIDKLYALDIEPLDKVHLASVIEHGAGVKGGKMDQYSILFGQDSSALLIDCLDMKNEFYKVPKDWQFLLINSGVKHNLAATAYNERRAQGEQALKKISERFFEVKTVRDVTVTILESCQDILSEKEYNRIDHVINENKRVEDFISEMAEDNLLACGSLLNQSHESLRDLYEVSCEELDALYSLARQTSFIYGARMMGGGFGGCTINLIESFNEDEFNHLSNEFEARFGYRPVHFIVKASQGIRSYD